MTQGLVSPLVSRVLRLSNVSQPSQPTILILESHQSKEVRVDRRWPQWTLADWGYIFILYNVHNIQWTGHHGRHEAKGRFKGSHFKQKILIPISLGLQFIQMKLYSTTTLLNELSLLKREKLNFCRNYNCYFLLYCHWVVLNSPRIHFHKTIFFFQIEKKQPIASMFLGGASIKKIVPRKLEIRN